MNEFPQVNVVDIAVLIVLLTGVIMGVRRGLSGELAGLIGAGVAVLAGWYYYPAASQYLVDHTRLTPPAAQVVGFVGILAGAWGVMLLLRLVLRHLMEFTFKGRLERIGGGVAGLLKNAVIVAVVILLIGMWPHAYLHRVFAEDSLCGRLIARNLAPVYDELSLKYPILRLPTGEEGDYATGEKPEEPPAEDPSQFIQDEPAQ